MTCVVSPDEAWPKEQDLSEKYAFPSEPERDGSPRDYRRSLLDPHLQRKPVGGRYLTNWVIPVRCEGR